MGQISVGVDKNQNNRIEECIGSAHDVWVSHRRGVFGAKKNEPWIGYLFVGKYSTKADTENDWKPIKITQPHIPADAAFALSGERTWNAVKVDGLSYARRYELFLNRMKSEGLYDGACFITTHARLHGRASSVSYECPFDGLDDLSFLKDLQRHVLATYHDDPVALLATSSKWPRKI